MGDRRTVAPTEDLARRLELLLEEALAELRRQRETGEDAAITPRAVHSAGRPRLTAARVRSDLEDAIADLRAGGVVGPPTLEALAEAHELSAKQLARRRRRFPELFRDVAGV